MKKILFVGESWVVHSTHIKGFDQFETIRYEEGGKWLLEALKKGGYEVNYLRAHEAAEGFPFEESELNSYSAVIFSDIGSNTFLLSDDVLIHGMTRPNRLELLKQFVENGGAFCMVGGYMSFAGIQGRARYATSPLQDILPVEIALTDDRCEMCQGIKPTIVEPNHPIMDGIPAEWPAFLGYNRTKLHPEGHLIAKIGNDPFIAVRNINQGKTAIFASDCSPHWATMEFVNWGLLPPHLEKFTGLFDRLRKELIMLPRERVELALQHKKTDRVPTDFWAVPELWDRICQYFNTENREEILQKLGIDIRTIAPDYIGPAYNPLPDGTFFHEDGTHRKWVQNSVSRYQEYASFPLENCETPEEIRAYPHWPKVSQWDWSGFSDKIGSLHDKYYIKVELGGIFELSWGLRGNAQMLMDMYDNPEVFHTLMEERTKFYIDFVHEAMKAAGDKIDAFYTYDDVATQNSLFMSKDQFREFIRPYHLRLNKVIKSYGKKIIYHSCGAVVPLIDELCDLSIDVLNPLQPKAKGIDLAMIKDTWGDRLCFHGAICIQELLPFGTPEEVYKKAQETIRILSKGGGYVLAAAHFMQNDTPIENVLALYQAARETELPD